MTTALVCIMDDLEHITPVKDTTFALLLEAQRREMSVWYANETDLSLNGDQCIARLRRLRLFDDPAHWFEVESETTRPLGRGDLVLMRCDPPVDDGYVYATMMLDRAEAHGARVVNRPAALRNFNEKLSITRFQELMPETRVSANAAILREFVAEREQAILKPLDGMGGRSIFLTSTDDPNLNVILETLTADATRPAMAQEFLPGISDGDKRVLMIHGEPVPYVLARVPGGADFRGNLARGGRGEGQPIGEDELHIARTVGPTLVEHGIEFAGLDVISGKLTEINVTSPTCVRELDAQFGLNISGMLFDALGTQ
ncbi:MAG: glutathione synthase [Wenzhouxiangellaceae bacterium]|nr:glutathione synthase [Wenzhouxiangellaceae bacterium]MBS3823762.1 glutathione synthase [Wenzhouxiangellaceae bacterium]